MIYVLAAILIFGVLIALHELGHFLAAKACGVRVNEYAIGMGPAIFKKQRGETLYALRLLPVGGYCAMEGEDEDSNDPAALNNQSFWKKLLIYAAGSGMNFITGLVIILLLYAGATAFYTPTITDFAPGCPLQSENGLHLGDTLLSIDGERIYMYSDVGMLLSRNTDGTFDLAVRRDGQRVMLRDFPMERREYATADGETYTGFGITFGVEKATFASRLAHSWNNAIDFVRLVRLSLQMLLSGEAGISDLSGPVGIVSTISEVGNQSATVRDAVENIAYFAALIAVNLAVMNLLPLPALDGGKIFFLVINTLAMLLFRRQIPAKYENYIHIGGLVLLLCLMLFITFHDVWKLFT
ncbi:MAG: site-2 protease family protein [Oscillospiraceae bacterium]|nr:site-2 protease family protein [Oscillospiraceae bacterium]